MKNYFVIIITLWSLMGSEPVSAQIYNPRNIPFNWTTDTTKYNIDLSELTMLLPRRSFPIIDYPDFVGKKEGLNSFFKHEPVICVEINGDAKAYPLNMLTIHEMTNDTLGGVPILPTYCPLCNSGIVYDRRLNYEGKDYVLEFEVSGMLRKSDMVMFDRETESWWQQLIGEAIVGELAGKELNILPSLIISVEEFFERYPDGKILSKKTGIERAEKNYGSNYYEHYDAANGTPYDRFFRPEDIDSRLPAMERVVDIYVDGAYKIYPMSAVAEKELVNDQFKGVNVVLFHQSGTVSVLDEKDISQSKDIGSVTVFNSKIDDKVLTFRKKKGVFKDKETNSSWDITGKCFAGQMKGSQLLIEPHSNHFAFAWLAFHPETVIYEGK